MSLSYSVEVIGFNATERIVIGSIFALSQRRPPVFAQKGRESAGKPDVYLVDASDPRSVATLVSTNVARDVPAVLIGEHDHGTGWTVLGRPIQWARVLKGLNAAIGPKSVPPSDPLAIPDIPSVMEIVDPSDLFSLPFPGADAAPAPPTAADAKRAQAGIHQISERLPAVVRPVVPSQPNAPGLLLAEATPSVREVLRQQLLTFGLRVDVAASADEAQSFLDRERYACVLLDSELPGADAYELCRLAKSRDAKNEIAVILLSNKAAPMDRLRGMMVGCDTFLTKPIAEAKLVAAVERLLPDKIRLARMAALRDPAK
jgi:twitching motility two-component system response regulator PilG